MSRLTMLRFAMTAFAIAGTASCIHQIAPLRPSSAAGIVAQHIEAIGGRTRIDSIISIQTVGILNERGTLHPLFGDRRRPNLLRVRMIHGGDLVFTEVYTGTTSWEGAPGKETCRPDSAARAATRHAAEQFDDPLITAAAHARNMEFVGAERIGGRPLYRIDITQTDGSAASYYVDAETFMLNRVRNRRPLHPTDPARLIEFVLDDYRPVAGVLMPFRTIERDVESGEPLTASIAFWIEANVSVPADAFDLPAKCR